MARGQYDLPRNRAPPVYGPQRPPLQASFPTSSQSSDTSLSQRSRPTVLLLRLSGPTISKNQLVALRTRIEPGATIQVVDNAEGAISALSRKPSAVIVLDNAISEPTFECARPEILRYAQNGGRLITDLTPQTNVTLIPSAPYDMTYANERSVEYKMHDHISDLRADHLIS